MWQLIKYILLSLCYRLNTYIYSIYVYGFFFIWLLTTQIFSVNICRYYWMLVFYNVNQTNHNLFTWTVESYTICNMTWNRSSGVIWSQYLTRCPMILIAPSMLILFRSINYISFNDCILILCYHKGFTCGYHFSVPVVTIITYNQNLSHHHTCRAHIASPVIYIYCMGHKTKSREHGR